MTEKINWENNTNILRDKVVSVLRLAKIPESAITQMTDESGMKEYWIPAFTHATIDAENNYETLEFYGDSACKAAFLNFTQVKGIKVNQATGTRLVNYYMSVYKQAEFARKLDLVRYIRYAEKDIDSVAEDAFESFFGALNNCANVKVRPAMGAIFCYNLIMYIFRGEVIEIDEIQKDFVTQLKELHDKIGIEKPRYISIASDVPGRGPMKTVVKTPDGQNIGIAYGKKDKSEQEAARLAIIYYADKGITAEKLEEQRLQKQIDTSPEYAHQDARMRSAIIKYNGQLQARGYPTIIEFRLTNVPNKVQGLYTYRLDLQYSNSQWQQVDTETGHSVTDLKIILMKRFADRVG